MNLFIGGLIALVVILAVLTAYDAIKFRALPRWRKRGAK